MKTTLCFLLTAFTFSFMMAQSIGDRIRVRTEQKVNERINRKIDEAIDRVLDDAEESARKSQEAKQDSMAKSQTPSGQNSGSESAPNPFAGMFGAPATIEDAYAFDAEVKMQITGYDAKGKAGDQSTHLMLYPKEGQYQGMASPESPTGMSIMDYGNQSMVTLNLEDKTGIAIPLKGFAEAILNAGTETGDDDADSEQENVSFKKTGRTKTIAGYPCEEYVYTTEENETAVWFTPKVPYNPYGFLQAFATAGQSMGPMPAAQGYAMEWKSTELKSGDYTVMQVLEIRSTPSTYRMADYKISSLAGSMNRE